MHAYTPTPFQLCGSGGSCQFSQHHAFSCHSWLADRWISDPNKVNKSSSLGVFRAEKIIQPSLWWKLWHLDAVTGQTLCHVEMTLLWEEKIKPLGRKKVEIKEFFCWCVCPCKKRIASLGSMQDTGSLGLVHGDDPERWYGRKVGGGFMFGNSCTPVVDSCWCMAKPIQYCKVK